MTYIVISAVPWRKVTLLQRTNQINITTPTAAAVQYIIFANENTRTLQCLLLILIRSINVDILKR